jgi:hypothetical protein
MTFAKALRAILRQDPDVIMIGEIRDLETAQIAVQASLTGHLVLATLHTNDAASAVTRLLDMGIEPFLLSSSLLGVMAQRLVRKLCTHCKREESPGHCGRLRPLRPYRLPGPDRRLRAARDQRADPRPDPQPGVGSGDPRRRPEIRHADHARGWRALGARGRHHRSRAAARDEG